MQRRPSKPSSRAVPSLLEGGIAKAIFAGFKGKLLKGTLRRSGVAASGGLDARGDPIVGEPETWGCEGFVDNYSAFTRAQAGIPETDLKVCIFASSLPAGVQPRREDKVLMRAKWYQLRDVGADPAQALWECQAFEVAAPSEGA